MENEEYLVGTSIMVPDTEVKSTCFRQYILSCAVLGPSGGETFNSSVVQFISCSVHQLFNSSVVQFINSE